MILSLSLWTSHPIFHMKGTPSFTFQSLPAKGACSAGEWQQCIGGDEPRPQLHHCHQKCLAQTGLRGGRQSLCHPPQKAQSHLWRKMNGLAAPKEGYKLKSPTCGDACTSPLPLCGPGAPELAHPVDLRGLGTDSFHHLHFLWLILVGGIMCKFVSPISGLISERKIGAHFFPGKDHTGGGERSEGGFGKWLSPDFFLDTPPC